jgi:Phage integrase, N-terminal SAM-like domain
VTDSTHPTAPAAQLRAKEIDVELGKDTFLDPRDGRITLTDWAQIWQATHQAGPATWSAYRSHLRLHILPRLGNLSLTAIRRQHIKALIIDLKTKLAPRSTADVITVLSLVLSEAVEDRRIAHNPCRSIRVDPGIRPERPHATPAQVTAIAGRIRRRVDQAMVITAACKPSVRGRRRGGSTPGSSGSPS